MTKLTQKKSPEILPCLRCEVRNTYYCPLKFRISCLALEDYHKRFEKEE